MTLAVSDAIATSPAAFLAGTLLGFWIGARFDVRRKADRNGSR